jgi:hypothetical protein
VVAAATQLLRAVSQALTAVMSWPTTVGRTVLACLTEHDSRLLAQVVRSAAVLAASMQSTDALTQLAVPVTTVGR